MPRTANQHETMRITINVSAQLAHYLDQLIELGLYGKTHAEIASLLVNRGIEALVEKGHIFHSGKPQK
ncbi:hypothetical protein [Chitiniphilus eburneus]|uniref:Uncharacterized protein n=1 Tax=Chitiniphilus eburneus TaxID=2571148 RepID=A0A4U0Q8D4_9NEIS|nr:hypothetical protein [Chitiniphilus eburneus]TJZ77531.1 hypothetical protein FAZ21_04160 [Chitiniphilus eburneus]